ncbi:hypothetical protein SAMN04244572_03792 [Azotobacter beijerinckii]|uniref:Uncharacterized protein n=1 Tax=Azotobacter beijerinckii TaxID=170623 RepID=A0A1H6YPY6_9GAMM|nr:hypothetical protein SAMN04244572_03792 [Azotobacter beijerinckii]SER54977.1 hypothetical protein SAMN04244573_03837 [Azotobacter beijerinckii]
MKVRLGVQDVASGMVRLPPLLEPHDREAGLCEKHKTPNGAMSQGD